MCKILTTFARTSLSQLFTHPFPRLLLIQSLGKPLALTCFSSPNCVKPFLPITVILWQAARQVSAKLCSQSLPGKGMSEDSLPSPRPGGRGDRHGPPLIFRDPMQTRHPVCNRCKHLRATRGSPEAQGRAGGAPERVAARPVLPSGRRWRRRWRAAPPGGRGAGYKSSPRQWTGGGRSAATVAAEGERYRNR